MPNELQSHTVRSYGDDLKRLRDMIGRMGGMAERQVADATAALLRRDADMAREVAARDARIDAAEREIEQYCIQLLALRQPMGNDLRVIVAALKVCHDLERIGDYAANAAKRAVVVAQQPAMGSLNGFSRMSALVQENLKEAIDALISDDAQRADAVWAADEPVDAIYNGIFREMLTFMMEDPRNITAATHLLFVAKNFERIGDHATNIAETVHYAVQGEQIDEERPKVDGLSTPGPAAPASLGGEG